MYIKYNFDWVSIYRIEEELLSLFRLIAYCFDMYIETTASHLNSNQAIVWFHVIGMCHPNKEGSGDFLRLREKNIALDFMGFIEI